MINRFIAKSQFFSLHLLHMCNDGYNASLLLLLPFIAKDFDITLTQVGLLGTLVYSVGIFLALPAAYLGARLGGVKTLLIALFLYAIGFIGIGLSPTYLWLFPAFLLAGLGFSIFHPVGFAVIAHGSKKEDRGKNMGNFTALGEVGRVGISAAITFLVVWWGWQMTSMVYGAVAIGLGLFFLLLFMRRSALISIATKSTPAVRVRDIVVHKGFIYASVANFFDSFASSPLFVFLPFLLLHRGVDPALLGAFSAAFFIGTFTGKVVLGRLVDRLGSSTVFIASEIFMVTFIILLSMTTSLPLIVLYSLILGIFTKGTASITKTMVVEASEHHGNYEKAFGVNSVVSSIGSAAAPVLLGIISDSFGIITAFFVMAAAAMLSIFPAILFRLSKAGASSTAAR